ncbi:MAG TPA: DUF5777 family beta-barrel protein, partial [Pyrinomonadaceae bacterium]|nr:DUF5777 family beta-barrel protein [Pyrinomonadaceae bacterium]
MKITDLSRASIIRFSLLVFFAFAGPQFLLAQSEPAKDAGASTDSPVNRAQDKIKVVFDDANPGVVYVESNGERVRVDVNKKTVDHVAVLQNETQEKPSAPETEKAAAKGESAYDFGSGEEPYAARLINVPTPRKVPKGTWNLDFTHRFTQPIHPLDESGRNLFGLDSFGVASFGVSYGITDKFFMSAYRSPLCQRGLCRVIEVGLGYNFLEHNEHSPIALQGYASVEGNGNFTEEYTYNLQARLSARMGKRIYFFFSPAIHINANGQHRFNPRPNEFFPPATVANTFKLPTHGASFGFGTSVMITPNLLALFEFTPRTGFKLGRVVPIFDSNFRVIDFRNESEPEIGFGIQRNIGKHSFALTFSNTQTT